MRTWMRVCGVLVAAGVLCGCNDQLDPRSLVDRFRILGVRIDPAWMEPGESLSMQVLLGKAEADSQVVFVAPDAESLLQTGSLRFSVVDASVRDDVASAELLSPTTTAAIGAALAQAPQTLRDALGQVPVYVVACSKGPVDGDAVLDALADVGTTADIAALEAGCAEDAVARVAVRSVYLAPEEVAGCPFPAENHNPAVRSVTADDVRLESGGITEVPCYGGDGCREPIALRLNADEGAFEYFCSADPVDASVVYPRNELEKTFVSWFSDAGEFSASRIRSTDALEAQKSALDARSADPAPFLDAAWLEEPHPFEVDFLPPREGGVVHLSAVVNDLRGGVGFATFTVHVVHREKK